MASTWWGRSGAASVASVSERPQRAPRRAGARAMAGQSSAEEAAVGVAARHQQQPRPTLGGRRQPLEQAAPTRRRPTARRPRGSAAARRPWRRSTVPTTSATRPAGSGDRWPRSPAVGGTSRCITSPRSGQQRDQRGVERRHLARRGSARAVGAVPERDPEQRPDRVAEHAVGAVDAVRLTPEPQDLDGPLPAGRRGTPPTPPPPAAAGSCPSRSSRVSDSAAPRPSRSASRRRPPVGPDLGPGRSAGRRSRVAIERVPELLPHLVER